MSTDQFDGRLRLLKDAHRLRSPLDSIVVYDRQGYLGFRLLALVGPTETGIEIDYPNPFKLRKGQSPIDCYRETRMIGLPKLDSWSTKAPLRDDCGARFASWKRGSHAGLTADVRSIICAAATRFSAKINEGYLMFPILSETESSPALAPIDRRDYFFSDGVRAVTEAGAQWLIEDILRLAPGLFSRNLPVGCGSDYSNCGDHRHQGVRTTVLVDFNRSSRPHDTIENAARYEEIVAAGKELAPRRALMGRTLALDGIYVS